MDTEDLIYIYTVLLKTVPTDEEQMVRHLDLLSSIYEVLSEQGKEYEDLLDEITELFATGDYTPMINVTPRSDEHGETE